MEKSFFSHQHFGCCSVFAATHVCSKLRQYWAVFWEWQSSLCHLMRLSRRSGPANWRCPKWLVSKRQLSWNCSATLRRTRLRVREMNTWSVAQCAHAPLSRRSLSESLNIAETEREESAASLMSVWIFSSLVQLHGKYRPPASTGANLGIHDYYYACS